MPEMAVIMLGPFVVVATACCALHGVGSMMQWIRKK